MKLTIKLVLNQAGYCFNQESIVKKETISTEDVEQVTRDLFIRVREEARTFIADLEDSNKLSSITHLEAK